MNRRRLGTTDTEITPIGLGCMQFGGAGMNEQMFPLIPAETVQEIVRTSLDGGVNWFDTAEMYGKGQSERALTNSLRGLGVQPGEVRIATKWVPVLRRASSITRTIDDRLAALQGYPVDLHQIHIGRGGLSPISAQIDAMADLRDQGKIGNVGVSNFSAKQMEGSSQQLAARGLTLASNQVQISLLHREIETNGVLVAAKRLGITLIAYSPLLSGLLTGKLHRDPAMINNIRPIRRMLGRFNASTLNRTRPLINELEAIGQSHGVSASQIALAWLITFYGDTVVAIPGASKPRQAKESADAIEISLSDKEVQRLDDLSRPN